MADNTIKVVLIFNAGRAGWSETYYRIGAADADPSKVAPDVIGLIQARRELMCKNPGVLLEGIRLSNEAFPNQSIPDSLPYSQQQGLNEDLTVPSRTNALVVGIWSAGQKNRRMFMIRGIPDKWVPGELNERRGKPGHEMFPKRFGAFRKFLLPTQGTSIWGLKCIDKDKPKFKITGITVKTATRQYVLNVPDATFEGGETVLLRGVRGTGLRGINGKTKIVGVESGGVYTIAKTQCQDCPLKFKSLGTVQILLYTYPAIARVEQMGFGAHKTGRAFFATPGRLSARCC